MSSVNKASFCLFVITWKTNGVGMANSDVATQKGGTFFDVEGIILLNSWKKISCWSSVSNWFKYWINW